MLYDEYEQKIIKKAKVHRVFYHFRIPIIIAIALVIGSSGTVAGTKGVVSDKKKLNNTYYYGETYEYLSEAFLSSVDYEFSYNNSEEWTSEVPKLVGHYTLRSKGKNIVNSYYYGSSQDFDIIPKPIEVQVFESHITYGDKPTIDLSSSLEYGDVLSTKYNFDYGDITKETWSITPVLDSIHIYSSDGKDVTNCYKINVIKKDVVIDKRNLVIASDSNSKVYDGEPLWSNGFEIKEGSLQFLDTIQCDNYTNVTEASVVLNNQTYIIKNGDGINVTNHYDITLNPGTLTVQKRPITLSNKNHEYTYDGKNHKYDLNEIELEGTLVEGEEIQYSYTNNQEWVDADSYTNEFNYKILKGDVDVTKNYEVKTNFGTTKINKRPLKLSTPSYEYTYNGKNQKFNIETTIQEGDLAEGETINLSYANNDIFRDANTYENAIKYQIMHGEKDVTKNYDVTTDFGKTIINKRLITFKSNDYEYTYNGSNQLFSLDDILTEGELAEDELAQFDHKDTFEMFDAGEYSNDFTSKIYHGEEDVSKNYAISNIFGTTKINKRPIKLISKDFEFTYDGLDHKFNFNDIEIVGVIAFGDAIEYSYKDDSDWIKVGEYENSFTVKILHDQRDVTANYDIEFDFGKTTINKCPISITTADFEKVYDDIPVINDEIVIKEGNLATTDKFVVEAPTFVDSGVYANKIVVSIVNTETEEDFSDCYDITNIDGTVTIKKVELGIQIEQKTVLYNGKEHTNAYHISEGSLVKEDTIKELNNASYVDAGTYDNNDLDLTVIKKDETDNLKNYNLTYYGREEAIIIEKRILNIDIFSFEKLYDAIPIQDSIDEEDERYEITAGTFAEDEYMTIEFTNNPTDAGVYDVEYELHIYHKLGKENDPEKDREVTFNYDLIIDEGTYTINKRKLNITTLNYEHVYNRVSTFKENEKVYEIDEDCDGLLKNQSITNFDITCEEFNVGKYSYSIDLTTFKIEDDKKNEVTHNYDVSVDNKGEVTIIKRDINVSIKSKTHVYDGTRFSSEDHTVANLVEDDFLVFEGLPSVRHTFDGTVENKPSNIYVHMSDDTDVSDNYNIIVDNIGNISILPRDITLTSNSYEKEFDGKLLQKGGEITVKEGTLASCDTLTTVSLYSLDNDYVHHISTENYGTFTLFDDEDTNVVDDYSITLNYGSIIIKPCEVKLDVYSTQMIYDGNTYSVHESETDITEMSDRIYIVEGKLPELYYIDAEVNIDEMIKPGVYNYDSINIDYRTDCIYGIVDGDIEVSFVPNSQVILARTLTIYVIGGSKIYDEKGFFEDKNEEDIWYIAQGSLALGDTIYEIDYDDVSEIGSYGNVNFRILTILDTDTMTDVTDCYSIMYIYGGINIYEQ